MKRLLLGALAALCLTAPALAAVTANNVVTAQTPNRGLVQFLQGTDVAGTYKTLYTAGANGSKCWAGQETNNDGSATHVITVQVVNTSVKYGLVSFVTVSNEGFAAGTAPKNWTSLAFLTLPLDSDGNAYFFLASGDTLQATFATALTSTDLINLQVTCADF